MITVVSGTNRPNNRTLPFAQYYLDRLQASGAHAMLIDLQDLPPNFLQTDLYGERTAAFAPLEQQMHASSGYVFVAPEYNGSFPGVLKAFLDSMEPDLLHGKRAALVGTSTGKFGNLRGLEHLTGVLNYLQVEVLPFRAHIMEIHEVMTVSHELLPGATREIDLQLPRFLQFVAAAHA